MIDPQIRSLRKRLHLSREKFAAALGFAEDQARITVWCWESGKGKPSAHKVALIKQLSAGAGHGYPRP